MARIGDLIESYRDDFMRESSNLALSADPNYALLGGGVITNMVVDQGKLQTTTSSARSIASRKLPRLTDLQQTLKFTVGSNLTQYTVGLIARALDATNFLRAHVINAGNLQIFRVDNNVNTSLGATAVPATFVAGSTWWLRFICSGDQLTAELWSTDPALGGVPDKSVGYLLVDKDEVQKIVVNGVPTGGTFTMSLDGNVTAPIPFNATAAQVKAALEALPNIGVGQIASATGGPLPAQVTYTYGGSLAATNVSTIVTNSSGLTGGTAPAAVASNATNGTNEKSKFGAGVYGEQGIHISGSSPPAVTIWTFDDYVIHEPLLPYTYWGNRNEKTDATARIQSLADEVGVGEPGLFTYSEAAKLMDKVDLRQGSLVWTRTDFKWPKMPVRPKVVS